MIGAFAGSPRQDCEVMREVKVNYLLKRSLLVGVCLLVVTITSHTRAGELSRAAEPVDRFQSELISIMQAGRELGFEGRRERLRALLRDVFDIPYMARVLLGNYGREMPADKRDALEGVIFLFAVSALASAFDDYGGQQFETGRVSQLKSGKARVRSEFVERDGDRTKLNFLVRNTQPKWRIVDLYFDGVSGIRIYTAEFRSVLANKSPDDLINELQQRVAKLESEAT